MCIHKYSYIYIYIHIYIHIYTVFSDIKVISRSKSGVRANELYMYTYIYICVSIHIYKYSYIYMYIYIHKYTVFSDIILISRSNSGVRARDKLKRRGLKMLFATKNDPYITRNFFHWPATRGDRPVFLPIYM
jgi:hypothetical protein